MNNQFSQSKAPILQPHNGSIFDAKPKITTAQIMYCLQATIAPTDYCFFDINIEQFSDFIERVEALPPTKRLVLASSLLAELQLMVGQRQGAV